MLRLIKSNTVMLRASFTQHIRKWAEPYLLAAKFWSAPVELQMSSPDRAVGTGGEEIPRARPHEFRARRIF